MALLPLDERDTAILEQELKNLKDTYRKCSEILAPRMTPESIRALDRINDAMEAIREELMKR